MLPDIQNVYTNTKESLVDLSNEKPVILVFLRHFGCIFCREAVDDISDKRFDIEKNDIELILVHMAANELAEQFFKEYELTGVKHISDPECELYTQFGLTKASIGQLFGLKTLMKGFQLRRKGTEYSLDQIGDSFQMPGVFLLKDSHIIDSYIHQSISDRPDYDNMIQASKGGSQ